MWDEAQKVTWKYYGMGAKIVLRIAEDGDEFGTARDKRRRCWKKEMLEIKKFAELFIVLCVSFGLHTNFVNIFNMAK